MEREYERSAFPAHSILAVRQVSRLGCACRYPSSQPASSFFYPHVPSSRGTLPARARSVPGSPAPVFSAQGSTGNVPFFPFLISPVSRAKNNKETGWTPPLNGTTARQAAIFALPNAAVARLHERVQAISEQAKRDKADQPGTKGLLEQLDKRAIQSFGLFGIVLNGSYNQEETNNGKDHAEGRIAQSGSWPASAPRCPAS